MLLDNRFVRAARCACSGLVGSHAMGIGEGGRGRRIRPYRVLPFVRRGRVTVASGAGDRARMAPDEGHREEHVQLGRPLPAERFLLALRRVRTGEGGASEARQGLRAEDLHSRGITSVDGKELSAVP